jgi:hypothetical protein
MWLQMLQSPSALNCQFSNDQTSKHSKHTRNLGDEDLWFEFDQGNLLYQATLSATSDVIEDFELNYYAYLLAY